MRALTLVLLIFSLGCGNNICRETSNGTIQCVPAPQPSSEPTSEPTPLPTPNLEMNPICSQIMGTDGPGKFLWKPEGDHSGALVVLFPEEFRSPFNTVTVQRKTGQHENMNFTGFSNGNRQTWRAQLRGGQYTGVVEAFGANPSQLCTWQVAKPRKRQD